MAVDLLTPILENGIQNIHFFHRRLLSAQDLREEQEAQRRHHRQLGRAIGAGVVEGLEVSAPSDQPELSITKGLAINALGQTLELPQDETIAVTRQLEPPAADAGLFKECQPPETTQIPTGVGLYVLVMAPASGFTERAPKSGLDADGKGVGCGSRYEVEGVQFRLEQLRPQELSGISDDTRSLVTQLLLDTQPRNVSKLRNLVAHIIYGTESLPGFAADPFPPASGLSPYLTYGALDELRALGCLDDCDVPLAIFYWTLEGILFVDGWSVRRRPFQLPPSLSWPTLLWSRRLAETEAMFLQFQTQLHEEIDKHPDPTALAATEYFRYLPPAGLLPVSLGGGRDVDFQAFLGPLPYRKTEYDGHPEFSGYPPFVDGNVLLALFGEARRHKPVDLEEAEMVWLYQPAVHEPGSTEPRERAPYMVFASCHVPLFGTARFDVARWDFSNFSGLGGAGL